MSLRSSKVIRLIFSSLVAATHLTGAVTAAVAQTSGGTQSSQTQEAPAKASTPSTPTVAPKRSPEQADKASSQTVRDSQKTKRSISTPAPIEPFIRADAVALGQWLMVKSVRTLVNKPADGDQAASVAKPAAATKPVAEKTTAAAKPVQQQQTSSVPKVAAVSTLPPEPSDNPTIDSYTEMRVALPKQASSVTVAASQGGAIVSGSGELIESLPANVGYQVSADERGLFVNGQPVPTAVWLEPDSGYVAVGDRWYRGRLLLLWQNNGVMAVNHVMLQDYLYSVVGAEMSASWSIEALKAQAVAARSYAIVHTVRHQRRAYDLDDTQRYQAYKGVRTEASSTHRAVHETAGEFISYGGGVVESLYAANQDIVNDAHSGYGMSQTGALDLAEQGYLYYEILSAYYPDTSVGRIDVGG
ncbi:MAG: SpoIID/LytB domain-containing protein [Leptolyngbyaceae cyanobacterium]